MVDVDFWKEKNVLVTGATGLLGTHLVRRLVGLRSNVQILVRDWNPQRELIRTGEVNKTRVISGMVEDYDTVLRAVSECDIVFHLAAQTQVGLAQINPLQTLNTNIAGTVNILEACRQVKPMPQKVIVASSDKAYGKMQSLSYSEDNPMAGCYPYDASKSCVDLLSRMYFSSYNVPVNVTRCANLYGGADLNWQRLIPGTIRSIIHTEPPVIRSNGKCLRDYLYVEDAVNAYLVSAQSETTGEAFNFGPDQSHNVLEVVQSLLTLIDSDLEPIILDIAAHEIDHQHLNSEKAQSVLGWQPKYSLENGLWETIQWYRGYFGRNNTL